MTKFLIMKDKIVIIILFFVPLITLAQVDSSFRAELVKKINEYRKSKSIDFFLESKATMNVANEIKCLGKYLKDTRGEYIQDSIRTILRKHRIFDYQFKIIENKRSKNNQVILNQELQNTLNDSLYKSLGIVTDSINETIVLIKKFVKWKKFRYGQITLDWKKEKVVDLTPIKDSATFITYIDEVRVVSIDNIKNINTINKYFTIKPKNSVFTIALEKDKYNVLLNKNGEVIYVFKH
jgi:hypothetical protein